MPSPISCPYCGRSFSTIAAPECWGESPMKMVVMHCRRFCRVVHGLELCCHLDRSDSDEELADHLNKSACGDQWRELITLHLLYLINGGN